MKAMLVGFLPWCLGCATTVVPPASPERPATVYLVDHGRHASLLLPDDDGEAFIEYAYGEWEWFALERQGPLDAFRALLLPSRGALARWEWPAFTDAEAVADTIDCESVLSLVVPTAPASDLRRRLEERFQSNIDTRHESAARSLVFVHDEEPYTLLHGCNAVVAEWLRALDCEVRGCSLAANFVIGENVPPPRPPAVDWP